MPIKSYFLMHFLSKIPIKYPHSFSVDGPEAILSARAGSQGRGRKQPSDTSMRDCASGTPWRQGVGGGCKEEGSKAGRQAGTWRERMSSSRRLILSLNSWSVHHKDKDERQRLEKRSSESSQSKRDTSRERRGREASQRKRSRDAAEKQETHKTRSESGWGSWP